jgi:type IV pilus assembly protein PilY1
MKAHASMKTSYSLSWAFLLLCGHVWATDISNAPLASGATASSTVKPNIAFVVDDSGSMDYENMPGDDGTNKSRRCWGWNQYNTLAYDPTVTYKPPYKIDGALYSDNVTRYPDASFSNALRDGYFPSGGYTFGGSSSSNSGVNLNTLSNLTPTAVSCTAAAGARATITVTGNSSTSVSQISVDGVNIMSGTTNSSNNSNTVASRIAANITQNGYTATVSNNVITITAPATAGNITVTPVVSSSGGMAFARSAFSSFAANECPSSPSKYYYSRQNGTPSKTCQADSNYSIITDPSQIVAPAGVNPQTNYANWYSYYRKRAYLLKAAAGESFKDLDESKYRVGLFFINSIESGSNGTSNHANHDFAISDFSGAVSGTQRYDWFSKLYASRKDGSTPLRGALSRMGQMYAGKISGWDPVQYSCQQNFTILSTDGFWNTDADTATYGPYQLDGVTTVGNTDGGDMPAQAATATITVGGSGSGAISQITVGGVPLMSSASSSSTTGSTVASRVAALITQNGYTATSSGTVITIKAPVALLGLTATPVVTKVAGTSRTYNVTAFSGSAAATNGAPPPYKDANNQANTLADVAFYYYQTDLRDSTLNNCSNTIGNTTYTGLCVDNVAGAGKDNYQTQHMTDFTIGLGVSGSITYQSNYESAPQKANGDPNTYYSDIASGAANWPLINFGSDTDLAKVDDLWHAAVNGRGTYYSAADANSLRSGIQSALQGIQARKGSAAAAATSTSQPVSGDNFAYLASYQTVTWDGDLQAVTIDPVTGQPSTTTVWSSQAKLDSQVASAASGDGRSIKYFSSGATNNLEDFTYTNLTNDSLNANFDNICSKQPQIAQCGTIGTTLNDTQKGIANNGANLVNYLRGASTYENETSNATANNRVYRGRDHVLGDIVNGEPFFVRKAVLAYDAFDSTYATFKTRSDISGRKPTVYVAANDGMLHAINAGNGTNTSDGQEGTERWAYMPRAVMPNLWHLADQNYAGNHIYSVDGSPVVTDICDTPSTSNSAVCASDSNWRTILVAGLNKGGCSYYALDITNPDAPKGMWEFTNPNLGYSYGNPLVVKNKAGKWVVILSSGYNNSSGCATGGDGNGHVFVLDAVSGQLLNDIPTYTSGTVPAGTAANPSGLAQLNAWVDDPRLGVADRLYGGDLLGNVWRIDFDDNYAPSGKEAVLIATLKDGAATPNFQPITVRPELAEVTEASVTYPIVIVGTGKYLGDSDNSDQHQQSLYAIKDTLTSTTPISGRGTLVPRILTQTTGSANGSLANVTIRTISGDTLNWATQNGWYMDFNPGGTSPGERINVKMSLDSSTLIFGTNVPTQSVCDAGGFGFLYFININNGKSLANSVDGAAGMRLSGNALIAGIKTITLSNGNKIVLVTDTGGGFNGYSGPSGGDGQLGAPRRTSWREIAD